MRLRTWDAEGRGETGRDAAFASRDHCRGQNVGCAEETSAINHCRKSNMERRVPGCRFPWRAARLLSHQTIFITNNHVTNAKASRTRAEVTTARTWSRENINKPSHHARRDGQPAGGALVLSTNLAYFIRIEITSEISLSKVTITSALWPTLFGLKISLSEIKSVQTRKQQN